MTDSNELNERASKSSRKREMHALQKLGVTLTNLTIEKLQQIQLDDLLYKAIIDARSLKTHEAKRRQMQYIGRLMRNIDPQPIEEALLKLKHNAHYQIAIFHKIERWRDKLIAEGDIQLEEFLKLFPLTNRQQLRLFIRQAQQGKKGAETALFRFLRSIIETKT